MLIDIDKSVIIMYDNILHKNVMDTNNSLSRGFIQSINYCPEDAY